MRLATIKQSREIDDLSQKVYGLTGEVLMESAGAAAAREVDQAYYPELSRGMTAVVCGPGNNGGDGLVLARHLHSAGHRDLIVFYLSENGSYSPLFKLQMERCRLQGLRLIDLREQPEKFEQIRSASLIIDALFGIGLSRRLESGFSKLVDVINSSKVPIISLDCPSGLNGDTGVVDGSVVQASMTLSFGLAKPGFFVGDGPSQVGKLRVLPIGFPYEALRGVATSHFLFSERLARRYLPSRKDTSNKSDYGHLLVVAGREGMWGAGILAASSAYRMGVGYVTWTSFSSPSNQIIPLPEVLTAQLNVSQSKPWTDKTFSAIAIGPGLGVGKDTADLLTQLKKTYKGPVVVDADAITTAVQFQLFPFPNNWVVTPHTGELSRILKVEARTIDRDRYAAALQAAEACGCHVLLKGFRSVLAYENRCMVIHSGNSALSKAGTGDVLTGMIGALFAQGLETLQGTATAAYLHGRMADEWVRTGHDKRSLSASDVRDSLPQILARIAGGTLI